jgi:hypothetical protein
VHGVDPKFLIATSPGVDPETIGCTRRFDPNDPDPDSTLILAFTSEGTNGRIDLVHLDVPAHNYQSVVEGWETHYWGPWRRYLAG